RVGSQSAEQPFERVPCGSRPAAARAHRLPLLEHARSGSPIGAHQAVFLALELLVEGRARNARLGAHLRDAHALISGLGAELDHRAHKALTLGRLWRIARHAVAELRWTLSARQSLLAGRLGHGLLARRIQHGAEARAVRFIGPWHPVQAVDYP